MARTAKSSKGPRLTDLIGLGVLTQYIPIKKVEEALEATGRQSRRQRQLPARVMVYYVLALALFMEVGYGEVLRCLVEGLARLGLPVQRLRQSSPSSISKARQRLGSEPLKLLYEKLATPLAQEQTRGAFYRKWRLVSLDGSTMDLADTEENEAAFGRPGSLAGPERLSPTALCQFCGERNPHSVWRSGRGVQKVGSATVSGGDRPAPSRHAVLGRPWFFQLPVVAASQ